MANPNTYKVRITDSDADLFIDNRKAGEAMLMNNIVIPANFNDVVEAEVRTDFDGGSLNLIPIILGAAVGNKIDLRATGTVKAKSFVVGKRFEFDYSHSAKL